MTFDNLLDLFADYLLVAPTYCAATGLSTVTGDQAGHDQVTRLPLVKLGSVTLWREVRPMVQEIHPWKGLLIIEDYIGPKRYAKENLLYQLAL